MRPLRIFCFGLATALALSTLVPAFAGSGRKVGPPPAPLSQERAEPPGERGRHVGPPEEPPGEEISKAKKAKKKGKAKRQPTQPLESTP